MMISCVQLDRTEICQHGRCIIRIRCNDRLRHPTMPVQEAGKPTHQLNQHTGRLLDHVHCRCGRILLFAAAERHLTENLIMNGVDIVTVFRVDKSQSFSAVIRKFFFHSKRCRNLIALINRFVCNKAVHFRAKRYYLQKRRHHYLKEIIRIFRVTGIFPFQESIDIGQVYPFGQKCLIITAVRIHQRHDGMHGINLLQIGTVFPVSPAFQHLISPLFCIMFCQYTKKSHKVQPVSKQKTQKSGLSLASLFCVFQFFLYFRSVRMI